MKSFISFILLPILLSGCVISAVPMARTGTLPGPAPVTYPDDDDSTYPGGDWQGSTPVRPRPAYWGLVAPGVAYNAAHFVDFNSGWVVGGIDSFTRKAVIRHTTNAGASWTTQDRGVNSFQSVNFVNNNVGYVGGDNGVLFRTDNAGSTWKLLDSGTMESIIDISFLNLTDGLYLTRNDGLYQTTDGGASWTRRNVLADARSVEHMPSGTAYVTAGSALYRFEGGVLTKLEFPVDKPSQFTFADPAQRFGFAVGSLGTLYRTDDGAVTWQDVRRLTTPDEYISRYTATAVAFATITNGMLLTDRTAFTTGDGGDTWEKADSRLNFAKCGRYFKLFDASHGWAFGDGQSLYRLGI